MTNERHEKALEAAAWCGDIDWAATLADSQFASTPKAVEAIIASYLQAMDSVIVPKKPDDGMMFAGGNMRIYPSVYMGGPPEQAKREAARIFETMVSVAPNHFTNGE